MVTGAASDEKKSKGKRRLFSKKPRDQSWRRGSNPAEYSDFMIKKTNKYTPRIMPVARGLYQSSKQVWRSNCTHGTGPKPSCSLLVSFHMQSTGRRLRITYSNIMGKEEVSVD